MSHRTELSPMRVRQGNRVISPADKYAEKMETEIAWQEERKPCHAESLLKNLAVASALVLCAVTLRSGVIPALERPTDLALAAVSDHSLLDEQLGKLSFVSSLFPEAVLVFGEQPSQAIELTANAEAIVHAWSEAEPYVAWQAESAEVYSAIDGEVSGVFHGNGDELMVQVSNDTGISCTYGNLAKVCVKTGDAVSRETLLGVLSGDGEVALEVFRNGVSIDPSIWFDK